jgi:hypothetical protein
MMPEFHHTAARIENGDIITEASVGEISRLVASGDIVVVKRFFELDYLAALVEEVHTAFKGTEPRLMDFQWGCEDHWRIDDNPPKSSVPKIQSVYIAFSWNARLPESLKVGETLARFRNRIAGLDDDFGFQPSDDFIAMSVYQHYPKGGGFIGEHTDPVEPQKCVINLNLPGDFASGGLFFMIDGNKIPAESLSETGDLVIFRPDICHGVDPIDPDQEIDFLAVSGRWRMASVLTENGQA